MVSLRNGAPRLLAFVGISMAAYISFSASIAWFYGLGHSATIIFPLSDRSEQVIAILQTAAAATFSVSGAIWFGLSQKIRRGRMVLITALAAEASLTVYALAGLKVTTGHWRSPLDLIFRSTFFAEYNWLTFILEVGPSISCVVALLLFVALKDASHRRLGVEA